MRVRRKAVTGDAGDPGCPNAGERGPAHPWIRRCTWLLLAAPLAWVPVAIEAADSPAWTRTGHPTVPADSATIAAPRDFQVERIATIPESLGSLTTLCLDPRGRLITAAQHVPGLLRITPPAAGQPSARAIVEKLGGTAAQIGWCHGLLHAFDSLYVTVAEKNDSLATGVYRLRDTDGDDQFDTLTLLFELSGRGEHGPHNLVLGPDGESVYLIAGNSNQLPTDIERMRPIASRREIDRLTAPGFAPGKHTSGGWVLRFAPDGTRREIVASGLRNAYDLAFNRHGEAFTFDSDTEGNLGAAWYRPTRVLQLVSGADFGWRRAEAPWPDYCEDSVPPVLNVGPASPTGLVFGYHTNFPAPFRDALFACDWTYGTIHAFHLEPAGAGYTARREDFLSGPGLPLTDLVAGADGALYFITGGRRLGSGIYRVRYAGPAGDDTGRAAETPSIRRVRRELEKFHGRQSPDAIDAAWRWLGNQDRAIRYAARVALEHQPVELWRERALDETDVSTRLGALLALVRQGDATDVDKVAATLPQLAGAELRAEDRLRLLRIAEFAVANSTSLPASDRAALRLALRPAFPSGDPRVDRELGRVLAALGDATMVEPLLAAMAADQGDQPGLSWSFLARNARYGRVVQEMLEAAPRSRRMHCAQMLLWLTEHWTAEQARTFFSLVTEAADRSKGGRMYRDYWWRIQDQAWQRLAPAKRDGLSSLLLARMPVPLPATRAGAPKGPGRNWTVESALAIAARGAGLRGRDLKNGRAMYTAVGCAACHQIRGEGGALGPDLSSLGQRFTLSDVLDAVINPSRAISDQYGTTIIHTTDGRTLSGRVTSRDAETVQIATNLLSPSESESIPASSILGETDSPVSLMPPGLLSPLNEDELLDLLAYLVAGDVKEENRE